MRAEERAPAHARPDLPGASGSPALVVRLLPLWVALAAAFLAELRLRGVERDTFWAEDARIFSMRAIDPSLAPAGVFTPLDGYTHVVPQLVANALWAVVPVSAMALAFSTVACLLVGAVAGGVFHLTRDWGLNTVGRVLLALCTVMTPALSWEALGNLANLHWFVLWLTPFLLLYRPRTWTASTLSGVVAMLCFSTEIQSVLFAPLLLWRITDPRRVPIAVGAAVGAVVQAAGYLRGSPSRADGATDPIGVLQGFLVQVPLTGLTGSAQAAGAVVGWSGWGAALAAAVPFVLAGVWAARGSRARTGIVVVFASAALLLWSLGYVVNFDPGYDFATMDAERLRAGVPLLRYAAVPLVFVFAIVALAVGWSRPPAGDRRWPLDRPATAALVLVIAVLGSGFRVDVPALGTAGPTWSAGVAEARATCADLDPDEVVRILQTPTAPWWSVDIPCERLR